MIFNKKPWISSATVSSSKNTLVEEVLQWKIQFLILMIKIDKNFPKIVTCIFE